ncbi:MAG: hypothetical protein N2490_00070 [Ignavibacteria bacterium]|nr:hypothetical protein [Ignavibacteria bacterium]
MKKSITFFIVHLVLCLSFLTSECPSQWVLLGGPQGVISSLAANGTTLFAGIDTNGIFRSLDDGTTWTQVALNNVGVFCFVTSGSYIFAGTENGVYRSTDYGSNWTNVGLSDKRVLELAASSNNIYAGLDEGFGVYFSTNYGVSWTQIGLQNKDIYALAVSSNYLFAGTDEYGVFVTSNNGQNWIQTPLDTETVDCLAINGTNLFAGTPYRICRSTNNGTSWTQVYGIGCWCFAVSGNYVFAGGAGVLMTSNNGVNWIYKNQGLPYTIPFISALLIANNYIYAALPYDRV